MRREIKVTSKSQLMHTIYDIVNDAIEMDCVEYSSVGISELGDDVNVIGLFGDGVTCGVHKKEEGEVYNEILCEDITSYDEDMGTTFVDINKVKNTLKPIGILEKLN